MPSADRAFVTAAIEGGQREVELGNLAVLKAGNPDVKAFGQMVIDDHSKANSDLLKLARQKNITLPVSRKDPGQSKLTGLSGVAFDREYARIMVEDHQKDVAVFEKEAQSGSDPEIKAFAANALPTLRTHLQQARALKP